VPESKPSSAKTPFENFRELTAKAVAVPKKEMAKREAEYRKGRRARDAKSR